MSCLRTLRSLCNSLDDIQIIVNKFADATNKFRLTIIIKQTQVLVQPYPRNTHCDPEVMAKIAKLASVKNCYMSCDGFLDDEVKKLASNASIALGCLSNPLGEPRYKAFNTDPCLQCSCIIIPDARLRSIYTAGTCRKWRRSTCVTCTKSLASDSLLFLFSLHLCPSLYFPSPS